MTIFAKTHRELLRLPLNNSIAARCDASEAVQRDLPFSNTAKSLQGVPGGAVYLGQLPQEYRASALAADYVIYSYLTPIAWLTAQGFWVMPETRYSATTSKHQTITAGIIHRAKGLVESA